MSRPQTSRAVVRSIQPGERAACAICGAEVKFQAVKKLRRIVANVYENGVWQRVEILHPQCYDDAGQPHGEPT